MNKLKDFREYFQHKHHPSIAHILCQVGNIIADTSLSQLALPFFMEKLRIEKYYLGCDHPDLASVLFSIGQIYERYDDLVHAKNHFMEALSLLKKHERKGQLYASVIYNLGLINYRQSLYKDAIEYFDLTIIEHQAVYRNLHLSVAEIRMKVGEFQLDIGKLQDAMNNFSTALLIRRMAYGNNHTKVAECLYGIGLVYEALSEFQESLNVLQQAFTSNDNSEDDGDDEDDTFTLVISHRIGLVYQSMEDADKAVRILDNLKNIIQLKTSDHGTRNTLFNMFGLNTNEGPNQAAAAAA